MFSYVVYLFQSGKYLIFVKVDLIFTKLVGISSMQIGYALFQSIFALNEPNNFHYK